MAECETPGCTNEAMRCLSHVCHCTGACRRCKDCQGSTTKAWDLIRGEGSTVGPFIVTDDDIRRAREAEQDEYIDKTNPKHPCHRGCTHIWNSHERLWRCIHCGDPDRARPAPAVLPLPKGPGLPTPQLPPLPYLSSSCCPCTGPIPPGHGGSRTLGINCQCPCHGRTTC